MKKKFSPEDFLTRSEKIKSIEFPISDSNRVIVLPNNEALGFRFNCYHPEYLPQYIEKTFFDQTVKEANRICQNVWRMKKIKESEDFTLPLKQILYWAIILSIIAFFLLIILVYDNGNDGLLYAAVVLISIAAGLTLIVVIRALFAQPSFIELDSEIMKKLTQFFDRENKNIYQLRGLKWVVESHFYWLELHILK